MLKPQRSMFACVVLIVAIPAIRGMSIRLAMSAAATPLALRFGSPRFVSSVNLTIPRVARRERSVYFGDY